MSEEKTKEEIIREEGADDLHELGVFIGEIVSELEDYYNPENNWNGFKLLLKEKMKEVSDESYNLGFNNAFKNDQQKTTK